MRRIIRLQNYYQFRAPHYSVAFRLGRGISCDLIYVLFLPDVVSLTFGRQNDGSGKPFCSVLEPFGGVLRCFIVVGIALELWEGVLGTDWIACSPADCRWFVEPAEGIFSQFTFRNNEYKKIMLLEANCSLVKYILCEKNK